MTVRNRSLGYDERPDPGRSGQQGVLFRRTAPAMDQDKRNRVERTGGHVPGWSVGHPEKDDVWQEGPPVSQRPLAGWVADLPSSLYHGTAANMRPGDMIVPGHRANFDRGAEGGSLDASGEHAFATSSVADAEKYARNAAGIQEVRGSAGATPRVFRVQPVGPVQSDAEDYSRQDPSYTPDSFQSRQGFRVLHELQFGKE